MKEGLKKIWDFIWNDDSAASWIANIILAFLIIRFILYPLLGVVLGTSFPIVAVISESMEHGLSPICIETDEKGMCIEYSEIEFKICDKTLTEFRESFDNYWQVCGEWYEENDISKEQFDSFPFRDGFDKGDIIILWRANDLEVGDILVFQGNKPQPIIHRVVDIFEEEGEVFYQTKGDHNPTSISGGYGEKKISKDRIYGKGVLRVPYFGWIKILFVDFVKLFGVNIVR